MSRQRKQRVSRAAMGKEMAAIADRAISGAFNEMLGYLVDVNPHGRSFVRQFLRVMRTQLDSREAHLRKQRAS